MTERLNAKLIQNKRERKSKSKKELVTPRRNIEDYYIGENIEIKYKLTKK